MKIVKKRAYIDMEATIPARCPHGKDNKCTNECPMMIISNTSKTKAFCSYAMLNVKNYPNYMAKTLFLKEER